MVDKAQSMPEQVRQVCVVGGGPAGLAAAIALRQAGADVTLVDCRVPPVDKACGEGLLPDSIAALRRLGIELPAAVGFPFRGIRFSDGRASVSADFPHGLARGVRRPALHEFLIRRATALGVVLLWGARPVELAPGGVLTGGKFIGAGLIVGADGQNSQIRKQAALHRIKREKRRFGFRRHYRMTPWSPHVELHWGRRAQIYVTPVADDEVCFAAVSRDPHLRLDEALSDCPELAGRLAGTASVTRELGSLSISRSLHRVQRAGVVLIGDASGSVDAITGEGMCVAFRQALALAEAVRSGRLSEYTRRHQLLMRRPRVMAEALLLLERNAPLRRQALAGLSHAPALFARLVALHVGGALPEL